MGGATMTADYITTTANWFPDPYWLIYAVAFLVILTIIIGG